MKPSRNALFGYTYQENVILFLIMIMDVERKITYIEIESDVTNNFDDALICFQAKNIACQMKDIENISIDDLIITHESINIKGKDHILSPNQNLLFIKNISLPINSSILNLPAYHINNLYIVSLSRDNICDKTEQLYKDNENRIFIAHKFFQECLDNRILSIKISDLPVIDIYNTNLVEKTINIGRTQLKDGNLLLIQGKPGVGKSHLVNCLCNEYTNVVLYRFWISNQDKDYKERLVFANFLFNLSKELFNDQVLRSENEIIEYLKKTDKMVIIDGMDHVENYHIEDLTKYISFIETLSISCKTIVLSRPLRAVLNWKTQILENWTIEQTIKVLVELFHISDYTIQNQIFELTHGYPILIKYLAEHYKVFHTMPMINSMDTVDDYYSQLISSIPVKNALTLFISSRSFFMFSELRLFLNEDYFDIINEFITSYPYIFDIRLNRISLLHDSLNTYIRKLGLKTVKFQEKINAIVYESIMNNDKRFLSRLSYFDFSNEMKVCILKKYSSFGLFRVIVNNEIDFESISSFYTQIRELILEVPTDALTLVNYYDLSLIFLSINRDHTATLLPFYYNYVKALIFHGFTEEEITSSGYLFSMLIFIKTNDAIPLHNLLANSHYNTSDFFHNLVNDIDQEEKYFDYHKDSLKATERINSIFRKKSEYESKELIEYILENVFIANSNEESFHNFKISITQYMEGMEEDGIATLKHLLVEKDVRPFFAKMILEKARDKILSLGYNRKNNRYLCLSLKELILQNHAKGSFKVCNYIQDYLRLANHEKRNFDITSISYFWTMYHQRKDYSVINMDVALTTFEETGLVSISESLDLIIFTQSLSEKGIRTLLCDYICLHDPSILALIEKRSDLDELNIWWFSLPSDFINHFSECLFIRAIKQILESNQISKNIEYDEIENVYNTKYWYELIDIVAHYDYRITILDTHSLCTELYDIYSIIDVKHDDNKSFSHDSSIERYTKGILSSQDIDFINISNLSINDITQCHDGNYSVLSDLSLFNKFSKESMKNDMKSIIYNALSCKTRNSNLFCNLYYILGNFPSLLKKCELESDVILLYQSFKSFLEISLIFESSSTITK